MAGAAAARVWTFNPEKWENYKNPSLYASVPYFQNTGQDPAAAHARPEQEREKEAKILQFEKSEEKTQEEEVRNRFQAPRHNHGEGLAHAYKVAAEGQDRELTEATETARVQDGIEYVDSVVEGRASLYASMDSRPGNATPTPDISISENILADEDVPEGLRESLLMEEMENIGEEEFPGEELGEEDFGDLDGDGVDEPDWKEREDMERKWEEEELEL